MWSLLEDIWKEPSINVKRGWIPMDFKHSLKCLWNPEKVYRSRNRCWCHRVCHRTTDSKTFPNYSTCQTHHCHQLRSLPELSGFGHIWWNMLKYVEISTQSAFSDIESSIWRPLGVKLRQNSLSWYPWGKTNIDVENPLFVDRFPTETIGFPLLFVNCKRLPRGKWAETESSAAKQHANVWPTAGIPWAGLWFGHATSCWLRIYETLRILGAMDGIYG